MPDVFIIAGKGQNCKNTEVALLGFPTSPKPVLFGRKLYFFIRENKVGNKGLKVRSSSLFPMQMLIKA